jgi:hypothetical protein
MKLDMKLEGFFSIIYFFKVFYKVALFQNCWVYTIDHYVHPWVFFYKETWTVALHLLYLTLCFVNGNI